MNFQQTGKQARHKAVHKDTKPALHGSPSCFLVPPLMIFLHGSLSAFLKVIGMWPRTQTLLLNPRWREEPQRTKSGKQDRTAPGVPELQQSELKVVADSE